MVRNKTRKIYLGDVAIGGDSAISIQSMTNTKTREIDKTIAQIKELENAGCDIVRCAVPYKEDAEALSSIVEAVDIPVVADIHFQPKFVFDAIDAGCAGVRVNPGNILKLDEKISEITDAAKQNKTVLRIGINAGSLGKESVAKIDSLKEALINKYGADNNGCESLGCGCKVEQELRHVISDALVDAAIKEAALFEKEGFYDFKISVKHHDPLTVIETYRKLSQKGDWPLHLGVTEAGFGLQGMIKAASAFSVLLSEGIGDTIRVSLTDDPIQEVKVAKEILYSLGLKRRNLEIISCPTCGRTEIDLENIAKKVKDRFDELNIEALIQKKNKALVAAGKRPFQMKVAVMGCIVNGPGEAKDADFGVACSKDGGQIFIDGTPTKRVKREEIIDELISLAEDFVSKK